MTQLRRDAAYIRTKSHERTADAGGELRLTAFDEEVCRLLSSAHTVTSAAKALSQSAKESGQSLEDRVAESMRRLLQKERIQLSPDS
jgi:hypothetical protein